MSRAAAREVSPDRLALRGAVGVVALVLSAAFLVVLASRPFADVVDTQASLARVGASLKVGSDVKMDGVIIGKVTGIDQAADAATVRISLDRDAVDRLPADVAARALPATVFGTAFVDIVSASRQGRWDGSSIPQDRRQGTVELQQALDSIDTLVKAVRPAELNAVLASIAQGLDGRGARINRTVALASTLLERAEADLPTIQSTAALLAVNLETLEQTADDLFAALADGTVTARTIAQKRDQLAVLLSGGLTLTAKAQAFLDEHGDELVEALEQARIVTDAVYDNRRATVVDSFRANEFTGTRLPTIINKQGQLVIEGILRRVPPPYYTRRDDCPRYGDLRGPC